MDNPQGVIQDRRSHRSLYIRHKDNFPKEKYYYSNRVPVNEDSNRFATTGDPEGNCLYECNQR